MIGYFRCNLPTNCSICNLSCKNLNYAKYYLIVFDAFIKRSYYYNVLHNSCISSIKLLGINPLPTTNDIKRSLRVLGEVFIINYCIIYGIFLNNFNNEPFLFVGPSFWKKLLLLFFVYQIESTFKKLINRYKIFTRIRY